jgi:hypothetical protein
MDMVEYILSRAKPGPNGCLDWTGRHDRAGYGMLCNDEGKPVRMPRVILEHKIGRKLQPYPIEHALHLCDRPQCVNADHLVVGDNLENVRQKIARKRMRPARGEKHGMAKLTQVQVDAIRLLYKRMTQDQIGEAFNISTSAVQRIIKNHSWSPVP